MGMPAVNALPTAAQPTFEIERAEPNVSPQQAPVHTGEQEYLTVPPSSGRQKVRLGEVRKAAVADLRAKVAKAAAEQDFEVGPLTDFGHGFDVYDPQTGLMFAAASAAHRDVNLPAVMMTATEVVTAITATRRHAETAGLVRYVDDPGRH